MGRQAQVEENIQLARDSDIPMTAEEVAAVNKVRAILKGKGPIPCTGCGKCSCPKG